MANKIRVIDLIKRFFNKVEMPKHIIVNKLNYYWNENRYTYESEYGEQMSFDLTNNVLNREVEILEEQQDIDIQEIEEINDNNCNIEVMTADEVDEYNHSTRRLINQLVQAVKQLDKNIKDKE